MLAVNSCNMQPMAKNIATSTKMKVKRTLTLKQLSETLTFFPKMSLEAREMVRLVLFEKRTNQYAADKFGKSKTYANDLVKRVYDKYLTAVAKKPAGWVEKTYCIPPEMSAIMDEMEEKALKKYYSNKKK